MTEPIRTTEILWTNSTWNPFTGCVAVSEGCKNCYAMALAERKRGSPAFPVGFDITLRPHKLQDPIKWKAPREIFVNSMSDLFIGSVASSYLEQIWMTMLKADWHIYQILTKRPIVAKRLIRDLGLPLPPHIWLGVSVENQRWVDERIPQLLDIGAAVNFLSCEPLLGALDLSPWLALRKPGPQDMTGLSMVDGGINFAPVPDMPMIDWVIDGGESGPGRRIGEYDWFRRIRDDCEKAGVLYFHKQGYAHRSGQDRILDGVAHDGHPARQLTTSHQTLQERFI